MPVNDSKGATTPSQTAAAPPARSSTSYRDSTLSVFALLLAFRIVNALTLRTFFQPDEFFQSLEPAWQLAFGQHAQAWITWEWTAQLRSSLHPSLFAVVYKMAAGLANFCGLSLSDKAELLLVAPKVTQALFAALLDCYTWKLAEKAYGCGSRTAFTTLALSVCSPWQWFCSTRTLSNCLETTLTAVAAYYWPWRSRESTRDGELPHEDQKQARQESLNSVSQLRLSLLLAAFACILRPTNALVWITVSLPAWWHASNRLRFILIREISFCGAATIACSVLCDRFYYQIWAFPPLRFLYFNIVQSLAIFYGRNRPDYYLTEGLPLLLTTALPFAIVGLWQGLRGKVSQPSEKPRGAGAQTMLPELAWTSLIVAASFSLIAHKEVRFLYPILPFLHVLAAGPLASFFPSNSSIPRKTLLSTLLTINLLIAGYASQIHQRGVIDVVAHLRHKHEAANLPPSGTSSRPTNMTVGFLMPCHSTPWRSHLVHSSIHAWALTCEPPLDVPPPDRAAYLDEADRFFLSPGPAEWLRENMEYVDAVRASGSRSSRHWGRVDPNVQRTGRRPWPQHLVFFEQLEPTLKEYLKDSTYKECWRGFNSHWHDDGRRKGDVVVWCLE